MKKYKPGDDVGPLEGWPFENPESNYVIVAGDPKTSGRIDEGGPGFPTRFGIWRCTPGAFECTEQGDELMTVLEGKGRITWLQNGESVALEQGDTLYVKDGSRVRWEIDAELTKVFFAFKSSGY